MAAQRDWVLGLDLGSDSIGWAAFEALWDGERWEASKLINGGVRLFDGGRDPQNFLSYAAGRGSLRRGRRRIAARSWRRNQLLALLAERGFVPPNPLPNDIWSLRRSAVERPLNGPELAAVLRYLCRHRGFKSLKLSLQGPVDKEQAEAEGRWAQAETRLEAQLAQLEAPAKTVGVLLARQLDAGVGYVRARDGIGDVPTRPLIERELLEIRQKQAPHHSLTAADWEKIEALILEQRPISAPDRGFCTLIPTEARAYKALPSAQRARIRMAVANLRLNQGLFSQDRALTEAEFHQVCTLLEQGGTHSWASIRKLLNIKEKAAKFTIETQRSGTKSAAREIDGDQTAALLKPLIPSWGDWSLSAQDDLVLRLIEKRRDRRALLREGAALGLAPAQQQELADVVQFSLPRGTLNIGLTACARMIADLRPGVTVREVENRVLQKTESERQAVPRLPELPDYEMILKRKIGNVTAHIALGQVKLIVNALLARYGHPRRIVVETTRSLKASTEELKEMRSFQSKREKENKRILEELGDSRSQGVTLHERRRRFRLWHRQKGLCPYTGEFISKADLESSAYEVDHIIPKSIGGTDAFDNLVLCVKAANQEKKNKTPYGAFGGNLTYWNTILSHVGKILPKEMHWRFQPDALERIKADDGNAWAPRQLHDTSLIAKQTMAYLQPVADEVLATRGRSTAWLRAAWDLNLPAGRVEGERGGGLKCRFDHRHHFIDAAIIGVTNRRIIKGMNDLSGRLGYLPKADDPEVARFVDEPFSGFVDQVTRQWYVIWPSLRPDRSIDPITKLPKISAELHIQTLYRALPHPEAQEKLRLASRKSLDALFGTEAKPFDDETVEQALERFVSPSFTKRLRKQMAVERESNPGLSLAHAARLAAKNGHFGPRGISRISVWVNAAAHDREKLLTFKRGNHHAVTDVSTNAWVDILDVGGRWVARVVSNDRATENAPHPPNLVMRLFKGDCIAWQDEEGKRQIGWLKVIKTDGDLFFWPLRASTDLDGARSLGYNISKRDGIYASANTLKKKHARPITITPLGRLRDPGFGKAQD